MLLLNNSGSINWLRKQSGLHALLKLCCLLIGKNLVVLRLLSIQTMVYYPDSIFTFNICNQMALIKTEV